MIGRMTGDPIAAMRCLPRGRLTAPALAETEGAATRIDRHEH
jgi:hypothetical protein